MILQRQTIESMRFENLSFAYDGQSPIFENLTLRVPKGSVLWVRASSGKGKSTLLRLLAGLLMPTEGRYLINDQVVNEMSFEEFLPYRLSIGYGFDMGGLLNNRTLVENLILPLLFHKALPLQQAQQRVQDITDFFGMSKFRDLRPFSVSGSQRKLTCVLRAFVHEPQVVLLDDPETGLKEENLKDLSRFIEEAFAKRGLKQLILCGESRVMARHFQAQEFLIAETAQNKKAAA